MQDEGPAPYTGTFDLKVDDVVQGRLTSFAGCVQSTPATGAPTISDCVFEMQPTTRSEVLTWLDDSLEGRNPVRDLEVLRVDGSTGDYSDALVLHNALLSTFSLSPLSGASNAPVVLSFTVIPEALQSVSASGNPTPPLRLMLASDRFRLAVDQVDGSRFASVSSLAVELPVAVVSSGNGQRTVQPGAGDPQYRELTVGAAPGGNTQNDLQHWGEQAAGGTSSLRSGAVELLRPDMSTVELTFSLAGLRPTRTLDAFPTSGTTIKTIDLSVGSMSVTP